jgi:ERCC4-related helicase
VATSVAEEGLDIGNVNLIISYDCLSSPIRMVQRLGRTGRAGVGKVIILIQRGSEEKKIHMSRTNHQKIMATLKNLSKKRAESRAKEASQSKQPKQTTLN